MRYLSLCLIAFSCVVVGWSMTMKAGTVWAAAAEEAPDLPDLIIMESGQQIPCKVLELSDSQVVVLVHNSRQVIDRGLVREIQRGYSAAAEFATRLKAIDEADARSYFELGEWCRARKLEAEARTAYERAIKADFDHADARAALGHRRHEGRWYSEGEYQRDVLGMVEWEGSWVTPEDRDLYQAGYVKDADGVWASKADLERQKEGEQGGEPVARPRVAHGEEGPFADYYDDGRLKAKGFRKGGQFQGAYVEYHPGGKPSRIVHYRQGELHGGEQGFDPSGNLVVEATWLRGKLVYPRSQRLMQRALAEIAAAPVARPERKEHDLGMEPGPWPAQEEAVRRTRAYRYLCNVPYADVELDYEYAVASLAATHVLKLVGSLTHTPARPAGISDALWKWGQRGCARSNLQQGGSSMAGSVDAFVYDSDPSNIPDVGHRRWALNPHMRALAFGQKDEFIAMYAHDSGRPEVQGCDWVAYPAPGYFPASYVQNGAAFSLSLSAARYEAPVEGEVKAQVFWADDKLGRGPALEIDYFHIGGQGFGLPYCVIFRPKLGIAPGKRLWVEIAGLKEKGGAAAPFEYLVEFCK